MTLLLTVPEVASLLRLSRAKVYELIARGDLVSVKIDGARRVRRVDLERYVATLGADGTQPSDVTPSWRQGPEAQS